MLRTACCLLMLTALQWFFRSRYETSGDQGHHPEVIVRIIMRLMWVMLFAGLACAQAADRWWEQEPLTILDLHTFAGEIMRFPAPELARLKATLGFNTDTMKVSSSARR